MKGFNPGNIGALMRQAQQMQENMQKAQEELQNEKVTAVSGGGMVEVTMNGKKKLEKISLKKEVVDPSDIEMLEDLILVAVNEAQEKVDELTEKKLTSAGLPTGLPF